jgi:hypothetical protein
MPPPIPINIEVTPTLNKVPTNDILSDKISGTNVFISSSISDMSKASMDWTEDMDSNVSTLSSVSKTLSSD